jgi:transposase
VCGLIAGALQPFVPAVAERLQTQLDTTGAADVHPPVFQRLNQALLHVVPELSLTSSVEPPREIWPVPAKFEIAGRLGCDSDTIGKWGRRFLTDRLDDLSDEARPGASRTVDDEAVEAVIVETLEETPKDATHWSTRSTAKATGMSQSTVSRIWRPLGLKPHLTETFKLSNDPLFVEKVRDKSIPIRSRKWGRS